MTDEDVARLNEQDREIHVRVCGPSVPWKPTHFILDEQHRVIAVGLGTWARWFEDDARRIVKQETVGRYWISTVFLGLNYAFAGGPPLLFETMVFEGDKSDLYCERYSTWDEAEAGHAHITAYIAACGQPPGDEQ